MARRISIADQMELDDILDSFPEGKRAECVSYLLEVYGFDNLEEYKTGLVDIDDLDAKDVFEYVDESDLLDSLDDVSLIEELKCRGYKITKPRKKD